ncbi:MAG: S41 family peptidase [Tetragenococcus sp.]|nr:S41 family peptidase [Tetragenococcus sp.]
MKNKKISFGKYVASLVIVALLSGGLVYWFTSSEFFQSSSFSQNDLYKVHALYDDIQENYYEDVDDNELIEGALEGMTDALDDPYTSYLGKQEAEEFDDSLSGDFEGIGATLRIVDNVPEVSEAPVKDSPAEKAGLRAKDKILEVDGEKTEGKDLSSVVETIRGEKGSTVKLAVERGNDNFEVDIKRDTIPLESLTYELDEDHQEIGSIEIASFNENTAQELKDAVKDLREQGAESFVIDLRQNPGGYLDQVEEMASMFLEDDQTIVQFGTDEEITGESKASKKLDGGFKVNEPTTVLVDKDSASASEIFAAALKESADIPIIGTHTFGKGTVQSVSDFSDNSEVKMTVQKWLTPKGEWINEKGVEPTIEADLPEYAYLPPLPKDEELQKGDESDSSKNLNKFLQALGYETKGEQFNDETEQAVKDFQAKNEIEASGRVDKETSSAIEQEVVEQIQGTDPMYKKAIEELTK